ncbi:hypothetical protein KC337_g12766, partial [Hortaea werneckii]
DSNAPTWDNMVNGQLNLHDAIRKQVDFKQGEKAYKLRTDITSPALTQPKHPKPTIPPPTPPHSPAPPTALPT